MGADHVRARNCQVWLLRFDLGERYVVPVATAKRRRACRLVVIVCGVVSHRKGGDQACLQR